MKRKKDKNFELCCVFFVGLFRSVYAQGVIRDLFYDGINGKLLSKVDR